MTDPIEESVSPQAQPKGNTPIGWQLLWFFPHLAVVYILVNSATPWLAGWTLGQLLPFLQFHPSSGKFEFLFSHILLFSFTPAFVAGLANFRFKHKAAQFVWLLPAAILACKFVTFPSPSVMQSQPSAAFHQYFGGGFLIPDYRDWHDFWAIASSNLDVSRGLAQIDFTSPFYAGIAYSLAAWVSLRTTWDQTISEKVKKWEERRFGDRA